MSDAKFNIEPINDRVVVRRDVAAKMTKGGIALPDKSQNDKRIGTVIAVGPGALRLFPLDHSTVGTNMKTGEKAVLRPADRFPMQCKVGDRVLLHSGDSIELDEDDPSSEVVICQESQLLAILR